MRLVVIAGALALVTSLVGTPLLIRLLRAHGYAQAIRTSTPDEPYPAHDSKKGTPSMGGLAVIVAVLVGYLGAHVAWWRGPSVSGLLCLFLMVGLGLVGVADDYLKIFKQRATGIRARTKLVGQAVVALAFAALALRFPDAAGVTPGSQAVSVVRDTALVLPAALFVLWGWFLVTATTNGVNLTDGLDGLATGALVMTFAAYTVLGVWQYGQSCSFLRTASCYPTRDPLDLAVLAAACAGATFGFLWWNCFPARIFMGDTGSLSLGGAVAAMAILTRTQLLLVLFGGLFLVITLSVIGQVASFKATRGRWRMFRMAPLHHHFEQRGWPEIQIVVRFWIVQGMAVGGGLALFYAEWVRS